MKQSAVIIEIVIKVASQIARQLKTKNARK